MMPNAQIFRTRATIFYAAALLIGSCLRLDQFLAQVLIDDEWHAVHQLIQHSPRDIFLSFGYADHSIPLTLLYWLEASWFGLSELGMRWPMMLCGLAMLVLFPLYVWRTLGQREAVLFALMLAISPILVMYSRIARPYAITLVLVYVAHFAFYRCRDHASRRLAWGILYVVAAALATWLHLIAAFFVIAPFLYEAVLLLRLEAGTRLRRLGWLLLLGVSAAVPMLLLVLPPFLANATALTAKSGVDSPSLHTVMGLWYAWAGTPSTVLVLIFMSLAIIGVPRLWRELEIFRSMTAGIALALVFILLMGPAWIHNSMTLARYLLPLIPLFLLATVAGTIRLADFIVRQQWPRHREMAVGVLMVPSMLLIVQSPLWEILSRPNSYVTHPVFHFDFRKEENIFIDRFNTKVPLSAYWPRLAGSPRDSLHIAAAPFYFESYNWDAPRWEQISGQTIVPAYLSGLCVDWRFGEVPKTGRFKFRNAVFLNDRVDIAAHKIDFLAYQKPFQALEDNGDHPPAGKDIQACEAALRSRFGVPEYEDDKLIVFSMRAPVGNH